MSKAVMLDKISVKLNASLGKENIMFVVALLLLLAVRIALGR